jgi:pimeloyl-ACP methyl ester carboxylesterase
MRIETGRAHVKEDLMVPATLPRTEVHPVVTSDGTEIRLTRYPGTKGPIVLAPGYGNAARAFAVDTVERNFVAYLNENGYDVWLLDYRASPELPASRTQFTVDDIATRDWPAAVATIRKESGADSVQALAHCVGGLSLFMALGAGLEGVRSAVFSALAGHPIPTPANQLRSHVRLANAFKAAGILGLNTDYHADSGMDRAVDVAMRVLPFKHICDSPVCRRICFVYGDVFDHSHLNDATHDALEGIFGITNITFFDHISRMIRASRAVDARGRDAYLSNPDRYKIPLAFMTGEHNRMFLPKGLARTHDMLRAANGPDLYRSHVIGGYAHLDCWLGEHSDRDVFPIALAELERHPA